MLELNGKMLCSYCMQEQTADCDMCSVCGYDQNTYTAESGVLPVGAILLGKYVVGKVLGRGGFGVTYLGYDIINDKKVAIKEYLPEGLAYRAPDATSVSTYMGEKEEYYKNGAEKFYNEAQTVSRFNGHPNIVNVYEFFYENNTAYFVMEYIDGIDFKKYIAQKGGKISSEKATEILLPIMDALMIVHSTGILHRDISPDNIYITQKGEAKLLDFGAARQVLGEESKSLSIILKQGFAPLEQYQKKGKQGPWSDIYALGATLYYAITGKIPLDAMSRIDEDELSAHFDEEIDPQLKPILLKALAVRANNRYQSVMELKQDINKMLACRKEIESEMHKQFEKEDTRKKEDDGLIKKKEFIISSISIVALFVIITIVIFINLNHKNNMSKGSEQTMDNVNSEIIPETTASPKQVVEEWRVEGYETEKPYKEYERLYKDGVATDEIRYTGNTKPLEETEKTNNPVQKQTNEPAKNIQNKAPSTSDATQTPKVTPNTPQPEKAKPATPAPKAKEEVPVIDRVPVIER